MKKRLLLALAFLATALTGFAHEKDSYVYTPQGRFQIVGENLVTNGTFVENFDGWTSIDSNNAPTDVFNYSAERGGIVSILQDNAQGIYYKLSSLDANISYVVSFTIASNEVNPNQNTKHSTADITTGANLIDVFGNTDGKFDGTEGLVTCAVATEILPGDAQTYSYAIKGDGTSRTYFIKLAGVDANLAIQDVQVQEANEVADFKKYIINEGESTQKYSDVEGLLDWAKKIRDAYDWEADDMEGLTENIAAVEAAMENDDTPADEFKGIINDLETAVKDFTNPENKMMDDFLPNALDKLPISNAKLSGGSLPTWKNYGGSRIYATAGYYYDLGHYQQTNAWGNGNGNIGLSNTMNLTPGVYVFSVSMFAACRENKKQTWTNNDGLSFAEGELFIEKVSVVDGTEQFEKVATTEKYALSPVDFTRKTLVFNVTETGNYRFVMNTTAKEAYAALKYGSVAYPYEASIYAKTGEKYSKAQLDYEADVRGQITAGRDNITKANDYLADETKSWGKEALKAIVDEFTPAIEEYEKMSQDDIIATYDEEVYDASKGLEVLTDDESTYYRLLASEVYRTATKQLIAGVRDFESQNAVIDGLTTAINSAEATRDARMYTYATGKDDLNAAIEAAKAIETAMRAEDYSEDNVTTVNDAIATLNEAVSIFKTTIPADKLTTIVDIDFSNAPVLNEETSLYEVKGNKGVMVLPYYQKSDETISGVPYSNGVDVNGELKYADVLRVGRDAAKVDLEGIADDAIVLATFDYYYGSLINRKAGYKFLGEEGTVICGLNCSKYSGNDDLNTFAVDYNGKISSIGSSTASNDAICVEENKTTFTITFDLSAKTMQCSTTNSAKGNFDSAVITEGVAKPTQFVIMSDYSSNPERRCWFDNLKIVTVDAGEYDGIKNVNAANAVVAPVKALVNGQVVIKTAKGTFTAAGAQVK